MNEWVWSNGGMILTGENWSTGRKTLFSVGGGWMDEYGAMVEWYWQGKTELLVQNALKVPLRFSTYWRGAVSRYAVGGSIGPDRPNVG